MFNLLSFILVLFPLIIIHEYAHLIVGKYLGAKPNKFAIGFGKPLFKKVRNGVEYSLRPFPLGGFVEFSTTQFPKIETNKEPLDSWKWIFISLAGPISNFIVTYLIIFGLVFFGTETTFLASMTKSSEMFIYIFQKYIELFSNIFSGEFLSSISGPVGIAKASGEAVSGGVVSYFKTSASISFALGFMNLVPLTVLDGGRALISLFETVSRRKINEKMMILTSNLSVALLFGLIIFSVYQDLSR